LTAVMDLWDDPMDLWDDPIAGMRVGRRLLKLITGETPGVPFKLGGLESGERFPS
jgi:hypothetical protein